MPKVLPEYLEQRRQQIQDAAAACFSRKGFHQTTMQDICEESSLSPGAVYRYFRSKEEIIEAMCLRGQDENQLIVQAALEKDDTLEALFGLIGAFFFETGDTTRDFEACALSIGLISEAPRNERIRETLKRNNQAVGEGLAALIRRAQGRGEINPALDPQAVVHVMIATYHGFITQRLMLHDFDVESYADVLRALFGGDFWRASVTDSASSLATSVLERPESSQKREAAALRH